MTAAVVREATVRPAPLREPPFDDELERPPLRLVRGLRELPFPSDKPHRAMPLPPRPVELPDPGQWARRLLLGLTEAAAGRRPLNQVAALLSPGVLRGLGADFERTAAAGRRHWLHAATVQTVRVTEPLPGVAELCATVRVGRRVRAVALRLEARHGRWQCTCLQMA